jgi:hypothetical protein
MRQVSGRRIVSRRRISSMPPAGFPVSPRLFTGYSMNSRKAVIREAAM